MGKKYGKKSFICAALAFILSITFMLSYICVRAAVQIDTAHACSVIFSTPSEIGNEVNGKIALYRVATVDADGTFHSVDEGNETDPFKDLKLGSIDDGKTASDWEELAKQAAEALGLTIDEDGILIRGTIPDESMYTLTNGTCTATDLSTGLYLYWFVAQGTGIYDYKTQPYVFTLPYDPYAGVSGISGTTWVYDNVPVQLKMEQGAGGTSLQINKTVEGYKKSLGTPTFVYDIQAVNDKGNTVYHDVASITYPASTSTIVTGIPADCTVTVREVYSGASYQSASGVPEPYRSVMRTDKINPGDPDYEVSFVNAYNGELKYGTGIENTYTHGADGWIWEQTGSGRNDRQ